MGRSGTERSGLGVTAAPALPTGPRPATPAGWYSRIGTRYVAVALVGLLVLGAAAYGVTQLTGEPVTANSRALAGDATVIVIAGADKAP